MIRRRMTVKRLDPWSVLKFGAVANVVVFAILMLVAGVIWFIIDRLELVDQVCGIATDVGFTSCGVNATNLFSALGLLGAMGVIVQTAVLVFFAFLYNLIADLTGGLTIGIVDDAPPAQQGRAGASATTGAIPMDRAVNSGRMSAARRSSRVVRQSERTAQSAPELDDTRAQQPVGRRPPAEGDELFGND